MNKKLLFYSILLGTFSWMLLSCGATSSTGSIEGTIENARNMTLFFDVQNPKTQVLGTTTIDNDGKFSLSVPEGFEEAIYRLRLGQKNITFPLSGKENSLSLTGDLNDLEKLNVKIQGSSVASEYIDAVAAWRNGKLKPNELQGKILGLSTPLASMTAAKNMLGTNQSFAGIHDAVAARMSKEMADSPFTADYQTYISAAKMAREKKKAQRKTQQQRPAEKMQVGMQAPNIELPSPDGKNYSLEDLKGKVVLLDFWASWCKPCRRENPHVVDIYKKYEKQGFTVFSVSLDRAPERWKGAIAQDKLSWPYHVSDLKQWSSAPAATYGVRSIPKTFLIDKDGKIAAVGLRGASAIENEVKKLL